MTKILAIETTEKQGSVAVSNDGVVLQHLPLDNHMRSAQSLIPAIKVLLTDVGVSAQQIDVIAVAIGPGSFTGLRVGLATARMLAYAIGSKLLGINTLQSIAANLTFENGGLENGTKVGQKVAVAIDAQRGDVSAQTFLFVQSSYINNSIFPVPQDKLQLMQFENWLNLSLNDTKMLFCGPVLKKMALQNKTSVTVADEKYWQPNAVGVTRIAWERFRAGESDDLWSLQPYYSRLSAAEEKTVDEGEGSCRKKKRF